MINSNIKFSSEARRNILEGIEILNSAVKVTLGPKGKNVAIFGENNKPHLTKDGVTVAENINLKDKFQNLGCQILKEAARRSADVAGDGTTTTTVLTHAILQKSNKLLEANFDVKEVISGISLAANDVLQELERNKITLTNYDMLKSVSTISANGEELVGKIVADAVTKSGVEGQITVESGKGFETYLNVIDGTVLSRGFISPHFATDSAKSQAILQNCLLMICNFEISNIQQILNVLEYAQENNKTILLIANNFSDELLQTLVLNKIKGNLKICAIKSPEFGDTRTVFLNDLATVVGARIFSQEEISDIKNCNYEVDFGVVDKVISDKNATIFVGTKGNKDKIQERLDAVISELTQSNLSESEKNVLKRRQRVLSDGICVINVGGMTELEMLERKDRVDDALAAAKAAKKNGIQPGGGVALLHSAKKCLNNYKKLENNSKKEGYKSFIEACFEPFKQIITNSGINSDFIISKIMNKEYNWGYDSNQMRFGDMIEMQIIDPHLVVVSEIEHSCSTAINILSIGCAIINEDNSTEDNNNLMEML